MNSIALLSNLAGPEGLLIFLIVLLLFGAKKLPELARGLGQAVKEFSKAKEDVNTEISRATQIPDYSHPQYHVDPAHSIAPVADPTHPTHSGAAAPAPAVHPSPAVQSPAGTVPSSPTASEVPKSV